MARLEALLAELTEGLPQLSDVIGRSYFAHAETPVADPGHAAAGRAVIYEVSHRTVYDYSRAGLDLASPAASDAARRGFQTCRDTAVEITPPPTVRAPGVDYFGNPTTFVTIQQTHRRAGAACAQQHRGRRARRARRRGDAGLGGGARSRACRIARRRRWQALEFTFASPYVPLASELRAYAAALVHAGPADPGRRRAS